MKRKLGLIQVYTGDGKGKTTAALGLSVRAVGQGYQVLFIQFLKGRAKTGELQAASALGERLIIEQYGSGRFLGRREPTSEEKALAAKALQRAKDASEGQTYQLVVLDEISHAINKNLLPVEDVVEFLENRRSDLEVVLTGREMPFELQRLAHLVSEIQAIKHPKEQGIPARRGIEF